MLNLIILDCLFFSQKAAFNSQRPVETARLLVYLTQIA